MSQRFTIKNKLFLLFAFSMMAVLSFLIFKNMNNSFAINSAYDGFQAGNIISDYVMGDYTTMSQSEIQNILKAKNSCNDADLVKTSISHGSVSAGTEYGVKYNYQLTFNKSTGGTATYHYHVENGHFVCMADESFNGESAAQIIYQAARDYRINPRVLIVLLEKEQGLITDTWPNTTLEYRSATGYGCPDTAACSSTYYGFKNQVRNAAELFRYILDNGSKYYPVGNNTVRYNPDSSCGSSTVYIQNRATSALYQYTPYQPNSAVLNASPGTVVSCGAYGNANFYRLFRAWFGDTRGSELTGIYLPEGIYQLKSTSGLALTSDGTGNGASAIIAAADSNDTLQQFKAIRVGKYYRFQNVSTGKYLDVYNNESYDGTKVELWTGNDSCAQKWLVQANSNGYRLISACSSEASTKSLDINNAATGTAGTKVQIWASNSSTAQRWTLTNLSSVTINDGTYSLKAVSGKVLVPATESPSSGANMVIWEDSTSSVNRFTVTRTTEGYYRIKNLKSGLYLSVANSSISDGASAVLGSDNANACAQKWAIEKSGNYYVLKNAYSGKSLDINGAATGTNNTKVQIWTSNSSNAQKWSLSAPNTSQPLANGTYAVNSALGNNLRLDVDGSKSAANGINVGLWRRNGGNNQKFTFTYDSNTGYYTISSVSANRYLDTASGGSNGANAQVYSAGSGCFQRWLLIPTNGNYYIVSACARNALDVFNGSATSGANVGVWTLNGGNNQKWGITTDTSGMSGPLADGIYIITSKLNSNLALDVFGNVARDGTNVGVWTLHKNTNQQFKLTVDSSTGYYTIYNEATKHSLDATGGRAANGTNVEIWSNNSSCAQRWKISKVNDGYYRISSACNTNFSLDIAGATNRAGTNVILWGSHSGNNQQWAFTKL